MKQEPALQIVRTGVYQAIGAALVGAAGYALYNALAKKKADAAQTSASPCGCKG